MAKDLTGKRFGMLTVQCRADRKGKERRQWWICSCDCGEITFANTNQLTCGHKQTCGNHRRNRDFKFVGTRLHRTWRNMKNRCYREAGEHFEYYGGRGISVCPEWVNDFIAFRSWALSNGYKDNLTLDRIDVNGNYEPSNCRWATVKEQANNKRNSRRLTFNGETHTVTEWAEKMGMGRATLSRRLNSGWPVEKALTAPIRKRG